MTRERKNRDCPKTPPVEGKDPLHRFLTPEEIKNLQPCGEDILRAWYLIRSRYSNRDITKEQFNREKEDLFASRDWVFEDELMLKTIKAITGETAFEVMNKIAGLN